MTYYIKRGNKYSNTPKMYGGYKYDSKKESEFAKKLDLLVKAGHVKEWQRQVKIDLKVNGKHICNYYIDFVVTNADGSIELVEIKGMILPLWQMKWNLLEALKDELYPGAEMILIK